MLLPVVAVNVLHISSVDRAGGAARAAYRLHSGLGGSGNGSRMLVGQRTTTDPDVRLLKRNRGWRALDRAVGTPLDRIGLQYVLYPSSFALVRDPWFHNADVLQLHNTHGSYFSHSALPYLTKRKPTVWLLHDMWPLTGHVAYPEECERWRFGCGSCPLLHDYPALPHDTSALLWRFKRRLYAHSTLTLVAPSRWLARNAAVSPLVSRFPVHHIPYGVDTGTFAPGDRSAARARLGLPADREIVLFPAADASEPRKGFAQLVEALRSLERPPLLAVAGDRVPESEVETHRLGRLEQAEDLADAYRAADLTVLPTLADNLPNVLLESLASGTPCVAFDSGGVGDVVRTGETGELVRTGDVPGLARAVTRLLADDELRQRLAARCREVAEREYAEAVELAAYTSLYESLAAA